MDTDVICSTVSFDSAADILEYNYVIYLILSGSVEITQSERLLTFAANDVIAFHPGNEASIRPLGKNVILRTEISSDFIWDAFETKDFMLTCNSRLYPGDYSQLIQQLIALASISLDTSGRSALLREAELYRLLDLLKYSYCTLFSGENLRQTEDGGSMSHLIRTEMLRQYLYIHYREPITLVDMAEYVGLSPQYVSKYFKERFGIGFLKYLTQIRLAHAHDALSSTDTPITKIALDNGFASLNTFNKLFKEQYGCTPREYRKQPHPEQGEVPYSVVPAEENATLLREKALHPPAPALKPVSIPAITWTMDCSSARPYCQNWREVLNVGPAENCLYKEFQDQLEDSARELHFKYARLTNVIDESMISMNNDGKIRGISTFTRVIENLRDIGLIPFLDLGAKARLINRAPGSDSIVERRLYFYSDQEWLRLLRSLLHYSIDTWGIDYVEQWRFDLYLPRGFSPDLERRNPLFSVDYVTRLKITCELIHSILPNALVGGPGLNASSSNQRNFEMLFKEMEKRNFAPDFISITLYPTYFSVEKPDQDRGKKGLVRRDIACIVHPCDKEPVERINNIKKMAARYCPGTPVYVTEYGGDYTARCYINDVCYTSAFIAKYVTDTINCTDVLSYGCFSDLSVEEDLPRVPLFGGNGLFTRDGLKKASYNVFRLLNRLGNEIIAKNEHCIATKVRLDCYALLFHNFKSLSQQFCRDYFRAPAAEIPSMAEMFENNQEVSYQIRLENVTPGSYLISVFLVDRFHGDIDFCVRRMMGSDPAMQLIHQDEIQYFSGICVPEQTRSSATVQPDGVLKLDLSLTPNAVAVIVAMRRSD